MVALIVMVTVAEWLLGEAGVRDDDSVARLDLARRMPR
jgi:hypothetical protein